jgi:hypothetical protein
MFGFVHGLAGDLHGKSAEMGEAPKGLAGKLDV